MKKTTYAIIAAIAFLFILEIGIVIYTAKTAVNRIPMIERVEMD